MKFKAGHMFLEHAAGLTGSSGRYQILTQERLLAQPADEAQMPNMDFRRRNGRKQQENDPDRSAGGSFTDALFGQAQAHYGVLHTCQARMRQRYIFA
jgi:hypothetical protein